MSETIILTIANGPLRGYQRVYRGPARAVVGRGGDCEVRLPPGPEFLRASRRHCLLEIGGGARIRDLGSRNGTFVNGVAVGEAGPSFEESDAAGNVWRRLKDGDEVRVGDTYLRVGFRADPKREDAPSEHEFQPV